MLYGVLVWTRNHVGFCAALLSLVFGGCAILLNLYKPYQDVEITL